MGKWKKKGVVRLSKSKKVILLTVDYLGSYKWLIVDVERLLDVIAGYLGETDILEAV